jgi:predicted transcriptional regulator
MSKLLSVSLPDELSDRTQKLAELQGRTRSEVVRDALRSYIWRERWAEAARPGRAAAEKRGIAPEDTERLVDEARASS